MKNKLRSSLLFLAAIVLSCFFAFSNPSPVKGANPPNKVLSWSYSKNTGAVPVSTNDSYYTVFNDSPSGGAGGTWQVTGVSYTAGNWSAISSPSSCTLPSCSVPAGSQQNVGVSVSIPGAGPSNGVTWKATITITGTNMSNASVELDLTGQNSGNDNSCTIIVNSTGNPGTYNYSLSGPESLNGSGNATFNNRSLGSWTITYTGGSSQTFSSYSPAQTQNCNSGSTIVFTLNFSASSSQCQLTFSANPTSISYNSSSNLTWSSTGCSGLLNISGGQWTNQAVGPSGTFSTGALVTTATFTLSGVDANGLSASKQVTVTVGAPPSACTIIVNHTGNPGTYNYSFSGPNSFNGSNDNSFPGQPVGTYTATYTGGASATFTSITPAASQTCSSGQTITFTFNFSSGSPGSPTGPAGYPSAPLADNTNTATLGPVPCGQINLYWGAGSNATSYNLYRSTVAGSPGAVWQTTSALTYTDSTASSASSYYYWVQSVNANGTSSQVAFAQTPIAPVACQVNLGTGGKNIVQVNGQPYTYNSSCIGSQSGTVNTIKSGDKVRFDINICNTGSAAATNVAISDDLTNSGLVLHNPPGFAYVGGTSPSCSVSGSVINCSIGTIAAGFKATVEFDADVTAPSGNSQSLLRLRNVADITYSSGLGAGATGCVGTSATVASPCALDSGYIIYYNGLKSPIIKEVNP